MISIIGSAFRELKFAGLDTEEEDLFLGGNLEVIDNVNKFRGKLLTNKLDLDNCFVLE